MIENHAFIFTSLIERTFIQACTKSFLVQFFTNEMLFFKTGFTCSAIFAFIRAWTAIKASRITRTWISTRCIITWALTDAILISVTRIDAISLGWDAIIFASCCRILSWTLWIIIPAAWFFLYSWTCNSRYENYKLHIRAKNGQIEQFWPIFTSIISHINDKIQQLT